MTATRSGAKDNESEAASNSAATAFEDFFANLDDADNDAADGCPQRAAQLNGALFPTMCSKIDILKASNQKRCSGYMIDSQDSGWCALAG